MLLETLLDGSRTDITLVWVQAWGLGAHAETLAARVRSEMDDWQRVLAAEVSPALSQRVAEAGMAFFQTCVDCCRACLDAGVLRGDDPVRLAGAVWALEHGWCEIALAGEVGASLVPPPRDALLLLLDAHRPRPSPPQSADH